MNLTAEVINLNGKHKIKVCHGAYLIGYFDTLDQVERRLASMGHSLAELKIKERS